jgi:hypothetical protein
MRGRGYFWIFLRAVRWIVAKKKNQQRRSLARGSRGHRLSTFIVYVTDKGLDKDYSG